MKRNYKEVYNNALENRSLSQVSKSSEIKERNKRFLEQTERLNKVQETIKVNKFVKNVMSGFEYN